MHGSLSGEIGTYLKGVYIENNGPLRTLTLDVPFTSAGLPKPVVLVGGNGSGKTNLLSIIADALFEGAAQHFLDVTPRDAGNWRPWFRISGSTTIRVGAAGSVSLLRFEHDGTEYFFKEKAGAVDPEITKGRVPEEFKSQVAWPEDITIKEFKIKDKVAADIFNSGVYTYFPSSRAEDPHWLNRGSLSEAAFNLDMTITKHLGKPIYLEKSLVPLKQWLLALLVDVRTDVELTFDKDDGQPRFMPAGDPVQSIIHSQVWNVVNNILKTILGQESIRLVWRGRRQVGLAIAANGEIIIPDLDALSAGQSILLVMFGTLIRYADISGAGSSVLSLPGITGICLVDEIDAHMHIDLQHEVLPSLIKLFPKVQFIVSSHSPLFVLGMEKAFGTDGMAMIDMPMGTLIEAESYAEFGRALEVLQDTEAFNLEIANATETPGKLLVLLEGETDPMYLQTAAELLDRKALLDKVEFA